MKYFSILAPVTAARIALKFFATPTRIARPESEMEMFHLSKQFTLSNGIAGFEWGDSSHPLVMLVHGWNGRGTQLSAFAKNLVDKDFRVVALDGPGHGASPGKMTNPVHYSEFIINAQRELDANGAHSVIAHSFGGGCAVLAASKGLKTKSLVLVASPAFYDRVVQFFGSAFGLSKTSQTAFENLITKFAGIKPTDLNIGKIGAGLHLPVLVVHDEGDNAVNYLSATAIVKAWPGARLLTTQGLGHRRILKDQKVLGEVAEFIGEIS